MTLLRDPERVGFLVRFVRIYREKRQPQRLIRRVDSLGGPIPVRYMARMPRRAAWQIAWRQALEDDCGCS